MWARFARVFQVRVSRRRCGRVAMRRLPRQPRGNYWSRPGPATTQQAKHLHAPSQGDRTSHQNRISRNQRRCQIKTAPQSAPDTVILGRQLRRTNVDFHALEIIDVEPGRDPAAVPCARRSRCLSPLTNTARNQAFGGGLPWQCRWTPDRERAVAGGPGPAPGTRPFASAVDPGSPPNRN